MAVWQELGPAPLCLGAFLFAQKDAAATEKKIRDELVKLLPGNEEMRAMLFKPVLEDLLRGGMVEVIEGKTVKYRLTEEAAAALRGVLRLPTGGKQPTWAAIQTKHLIPLAFGLKDEPNEKWAEVAKKTGLEAAVIAWTQDRDAKPDANPKEIAESQKAEERVAKAEKKPGDKASAIMDAWFWRQLGFQPDGPFTLAKLKTAIYKQALDTNLNAKPAKYQSLLVVRELGIAQSTPAAIRRGVLCRWVRPLERGAAPAPLFVHALRLALAAYSPGRHGGDRMFIGHAHAAYCEAVGPRDMPLDTFKQGLIEAHRQGRIDLCRADLVESMDPRDVSASETPYLGAVFHFIRLS